MQKIVITGGAGFIGHHLVKKLAGRNHNIIIIDNLSNNSRKFLNEIEESKSHGPYQQVTLHNADIRDEQALSDILRHETIHTCIHLAAKTSVQDSIVRPFETLDINVRGTLTLLEACSKYKIQNFLFASSAAVYGNPRKLPVSEETTMEPISLYGATKVAGEALVSSYMTKIKNCISLRFFNIYGEGQNSTYAGVISKFKERLSNQLPPIIYGDGHQIRDFISVNDVVDAIIFVVENTIINNDAGGPINTFNIGSGRPTSIQDLAAMMIDIFKLNEEIKPIYSDPVAGDIRYTYADIRKAKNVLQLNEQEDLKVGLTDLLE